MSAQLYLYPGAEKAGGEARMRQCASLFGQLLGLERSAFSRIRRTERGKPFFPDAPGVFCSVSHTAGYWACAISDAPVGLDVEKNRQCDFEAIARRFFHAAEAEYAAQNPGAFFAVWTAKESYVKLLGRGIDEGFGKFSVVREGGIAKTVGNVKLCPICLEPGYTMCICGENLGEIQQVWMR